MEPFIKQVSEFSLIKLTSQIQNYAKPLVEPIYDTEKGWFYTTEQLKGFINSAEWNLGNFCF
jgi:hypothetical protein